MVVAGNRKSGELRFEEPLIKVSLGCSRRAVISVPVSIIAPVGGSGLNVKSNLLNCSSIVGAVLLSGLGCFSVNEVSGARDSFVRRPCEYLAGYSRCIVTAPFPFE